MRLRQIALVAQDLEAQTTALCETLGIEVAYRDPGVGVFGLKNIVAPVGGEFIEIVSPDQEETSAARYMERRGGDSGYMVILQTDDAARERRRIADKGIRVIWEIDRPDHVAGQYHPSDIGGVLLSIESEPGVTDVDEKMCNWPPAGSAWRDHVATERVSGITGVDIQAADPAAMAEQWGEILEAEVDSAREEMRAIRLSNATLRFVPVRDRRGPGIRSVDVACGRSRSDIVMAAARRRLPFSNDSVTICGTVFNLR